jgi:hypothetical protein
MSIATAISNLKLLSFDYHGHSRVVEPHTYGVDTKGHRALRAYQVRGGSRSGASGGWRVFHERDMSNVTVLSEGFTGPRPDYKQGDSQFRSIVAQL